MPSTDARWTIGAVLALGAILIGQNAGINGRLDRIDARMDRIETRLDGFDGRLRAVEVAFGKVDQRLATLERLHLPTPALGE